jgi:hypothetical protein
MEGQEIIKVKGVAKEQSAELTIADMTGLLTKESSKLFSQHKWYKDAFKARIEVAEVAYELKVTSNKRMAQYEQIIATGGMEFSIYTHSTPLNYNDIEIK